MVECDVICRHSPKQQAKQSESNVLQNKSFTELMLEFLQFHKMKLLKNPTHNVGVKC